MQQPTGGEALAAALADHGVDTVFGIPGTHNLGVFSALVENGVRPILTRHEQGAGYAADGYARTSGRPGVCLTTTGPAILNAAAAAAQAWSDSVPVLFISPGMPTGHPARGNGLLHEVKDQRAAMDAIVAYSHRVRSVGEIPHAVAAAFAAMTAGRPRPVHLEIPLDLIDARADARAVAPTKSAPPMPDAGELATAAELLAAAQRPVIIVGGGARWASESVRRLAEQLGAPVITSANGKGVLDEQHPLAIGAGLHHPSVRALVENADVVLAVGTELAPSDLWNGPFRLSGTTIRVDIDPAAVITNIDPRVRLIGDAARTIDTLLALLPVDPRVTTRAARARDGLIADAAAEGEPYLDMLAALRTVVDEKTIVVGDSTMACYYGILSGLRVRRAGGFLYPTGMGTLGYGLPAAIGAKLADPDAHVLAVLGDGGVMFTIAELAGAAQLGLALPVLVVDNGGYGEIRDEMVQRGEEPVAVALDRVDFPAAARAMGCYGVPVTADTLAGAVEQAWAADRPTVLHLPLQLR
ncbi:5-guanidino-2-oxopentanoate decarboxylase [Nocardia sp. NBC_00403]|uniref:5-guanidino-2-oxopentanoate decarboxylase n=1 Tax=Nocardia sp. NBC_00403 TaxID=2975990 RepID=UPI002E215A9D